MKVALLNAWCLFCRSLKPGQGPNPAALGLIVEILCFCVQNHGYRIKYYVLQHGAMEKTLRLLQRREKWLKIAAVRFVRSCLAIKDDFYNRHMVQPLFRASRMTKKEKAL